MPILEIRNVTRRFGDFVAVDDVSLSIEAGEFFTLLGPSGCGKTTLLRMIAGFDLPDAGQILLDGQDLGGTPPERRPVHTVFQSYALFPHMSVADNIAFPLRMARRPVDEVERRVTEALDEVHLSDKRASFPHELSGGQKQRVALARGLVNRPRLLLLDEPLGALDAKLRQEMERELISLQRDIGITFVFVTHAQAEALALSHRIAVMREGRVEQMDEPAQLYSRPRNRFVAGFIGRINLFDAEVLATGQEGLRLRVDGIGEVVTPIDSAVPAPAVGLHGAFALRPEQVRLAAAGERLAGEANQVDGRIDSAFYIGEVTTYRVSLGNGASIDALLPNAGVHARRLANGTPVRLGWPVEAGRFLAE